MNENLNLCEILKDCPKGTKLYSPMFGDCEFLGVLSDYVRIHFNYASYNINPNGTFPFGYIDSEEIMLFPSREQRDWSKFNVNKPKFDPKTLCPFDRVIVSDVGNYEWKCRFFSHIDEDGNILLTSGGVYHKCIPYNEETKHLIGTSDKAPEFYRYWE